MIVTFTDFGAFGPYLGQLHAVILGQMPGGQVVDLVSNAPTCNPYASAYLLAALTHDLPVGTVVLAVVDPGVGGDRPPVIVESLGRWYVGPGNGLFELIARHPAARQWEITWRPRQLSSTFHGRDLFAPVAARLALGDAPELFGAPLSFAANEWPDDLDQIVYVDHYGNAMTGRRGETLPPSSRFVVAGQEILWAERFEQVAKGQPFWYVNSCGLVEIAVNQGRADRQLGLDVGCPVTCRKS